VPVIVTTEPLTKEVPEAGEEIVDVGGAVMNTTSTQYAADWYVSVGNPPEPY
jgi:hypothetical protein